MIFLLVRAGVLALLRPVVYKTRIVKLREVFVRGMFAALFLGVLTSTLASAGNRLPDCNDVRGNPIPVDNARVIKLKTTTKNQYLDRANVNGVLVGVFPSKGGHVHLDVFLGETPNGTGKESDIEIVYNQAFGRVDTRTLKPGMEVAACGDFINSFEPTGRYPASPVGAIIHWVHMAPRPPHQSGFMAIDGRLYGQTDPQDRFFNGFVEDDFLDFWKFAN